MRVIPGLLLFVLASAAVTGERAQLLDEILARHAEALGAPVAAVEIDLDIVEPEFAVTANYQADRDGDMRIDVYADGERVFSEGIENGSVWQWHAGEPEPQAVSKEGRGALARGVVKNLYGLHEWPQLGYSLRYAGYEVVGDRCYLKIHTRAPDGFEETVWLNMETALVERTASVRAFHPDIDPTKRPTVTIFSDFRREDGRVVSFASRTIDGETGETLAETTIRRYRAEPLSLAAAETAD